MRWGSLPLTAGGPARTCDERLRAVPFIRQALLTPPLIFRTPTNTRTGQFLKTDLNPIDGIDLSPDEWLCFPARVGPVVVFVYFHHRFMSLGCSLANLFELATDEEVAAGPDALYLYGAPAEVLARFGDLPTVFHEDPASGLLVAAVPDEDRLAYFGSLKKMNLTLHNVAIMRRGRMPFHQGDGPGAASRWAGSEHPDHRRHSDRQG